VKFEIKHAVTGNVIFTAEIDDSFENYNEAVKLGAAVKLVIKAGADLSGAYLRAANLSSADLSGADLSSADLSGADLRGANLSGANLSDADLGDAYLGDAFLGGANSIIDGGVPDGWRCVGWLKNGVIMLRVGCRNKTIADGREYWANKENRREIMAAIDYIEAVAKIRGWVK